MSWIIWLLYTCFSTGIIQCIRIKNCRLSNSKLLLMNNKRHRQASDTWLGDRHHTNQLYSNITEQEENNTTFHRYSEADQPEAAYSIIWQSAGGIFYANQHISNLWKYLGKWYTLEQTSIVQLSLNSVDKWMWCITDIVIIYIRHGYFLTWLCPGTYSCVDNLA